MVFKLPHGGRKRLISRWNSHLSSHKIDPDSHFSILDDLLTRYSEPQRVYHNLAHIDKLLELLSKSQSDGALEFAVWFHDAVYDPTRSDNEEQSAQVATQRLGQMQVNSALIGQVENLILATKTHIAKNQTEQWLIEADLSILGAPEKTYTAYAKAIRQEYSWIPDEIFFPRRITILESFLEREHIFNLERFERLESRARENMLEEIQQLQEGRLPNPEA